MTQTNLVNPIFLRSSYYSTLIVILLVPFNLCAQNELQFSVNYSNSHMLQQDVYGVNNWISTRRYQYNDADFIDYYDNLGKPAIRYPGGTPSNYLDLNTGLHKAWTGAKTNDTDRVTQFNNGMSNNGKANGEELSRFLDFKDQTNATSTFTLNTASMSISEIETMLDDIVDSGEVLDYVEIGNELYFDSYNTIIPNVETYIEKAKRRATAVRNRFPDAKIGVIIPSHIYTKESFLPSGESANLDRSERWYNGIKGEDFYDAIIIHMYSTVGMGSSVTEANFLDYKVAYKYSLSHADNKFDEVFLKLGTDFPGKKIWVTEYHVGGFSGEVRNYRLRHSYLGGLYAANFMLKLFSDVNTTLGSWHSLVQWQDGTGNAFGTQVNYDFFTLFNEPVSNSQKFVSVDFSNTTINYDGLGDNQGRFSDVESGIFYNPDTLKGYVTIINKWTNSYVIDKDALEASIGGTITQVTETTPDENLSEVAGFESETTLTQGVVTAVNGSYALSPFSIYVVEYDLDQQTIDDTQDLIGNGGFEDIKEHLAALPASAGSTAASNGDTWYKGANGGTAIIVNEFAYEGTSALNISNFANSDGGGGPVQAIRYFTAEANTDYTLSFFYRNDDPSGFGTGDTYKHRISINVADGSTIYGTPSSTAIDENIIQPFKDDDSNFKEYTAAFNSGDNSQFVLVYTRPDKGSSGNISARLDYFTIVPTASLSATQKSLAEYNFKVYPNPVQNTLYFSATQKIERVQLYNHLGQELLTFNQLNNHSKLDVSNLNAGLLFMKVTIGEDTGVYKLLKR